jgi:outer membrane protein OmpA-like peptidoglycan-associated protein
MFNGRIKLGGWIGILAIIGLLIWGAASLGLLDKIMPGFTTTESQTLEKSTVQKVVVDDKYSGAIDVIMPSNTPVTSNKPVKVMVAAWNSQMGWIFSNGGVTTTEGSYMAQNNVDLTFVRNDDYGQMQQGLMAHARACARGDYFSGEGVTFAAFMGDGAPGFLEAVNSVLEKELGPEFIVEGVDVAGFSYGEDKWLGPPEWKSNPQSARGSLTIVVPRDGDFNICLKWASDNQIDVNPDGTTYDPNALNFYWANSFTQAAQLFIAGVTETRPVVKNGKRTGEKRSIKAEGVSTWLPGDQQVVDQRGGVITIADTKDYAGQMPCLIVGIKAFNLRNADIVEGMINAIDLGSKAVRSSDQARMRAAEVSAAIYNENTPEYWYKYFDGEPRNVEINGKTYMVSLGGSRVCTIADVLLYFGQTPGSRNVFKDTYDYFGRQYVKLYPEFLSSYQPYEKVINLTYLNKAKNKANITAPTAMAKFQAGSEVTSIVGKKSWSIEFAFGSAQLTPQAEVTLEQLSSELTMGYELKMIIAGHTDSVGNEYNNQKLSEARATAVRDWLYQRYPVNFPIDRMNVVGYGETKPVADNATAEGRGKNRRVDVTVGR